MINKKHYIHIPNLITAARIICALLLLLTRPLALSFYILYIICGLSDMLDGFLARKLKVTSELGAVLDSIADFVFLVVIMFKILPILSFKTWQIYWIIGIAAIRFTAVGISAIRFRTFTMLHTYLNKLTGFLLFLFPLCLGFLSFRVLFIIECSVATLSSLEELVLDCTIKQIDRDKKGLFVHR